MLKKSISLISLIFIASFSLFSINAAARTEINLNLSLAAVAPPPPPANMVMAPPQGYNNCYMTPGTWVGNVWVPPHQACEYPAPSGTAMWVSGYWGCMTVGPNGDCGHWKWFSHRWVRGGQVAYYGHHRHFHDRHYW